MLSSITRTCGECDLLSPSRACVLVTKGKMEGRAWPLVNQPRQCLGFMPLKESYDNRTGRELWPYLGLISQFDQVGKVAGDAIRLVATELSTGSKSASQVIKAGAQAGINSRAIQRAAERLMVEKTRPKFRGGWVWSLREGDM